MKFTFRSGQRPLEGFTIKRGVGQGGFGEVYFAVSDSGKEVALKYLYRSPDAELRGIAHCLNLKHTNIVHLYDLRTDDQENRWVVMEYVFGESLARWINRYPTGLPQDLVKEWFGAIARGVAYLHDQGIVHRDLKPGNIFIESGQVKIGDYGLSRRISGSQGGELTQGVGTAQYMAPEIKNGNYSLSIDIYACGVILYEMLCGSRPFEGQSTAEVMMKHLTDTPDLSRIPERFRSVVARALDKNPGSRFSGMREFAREVEAIGRVDETQVPFAEAVTSTHRGVEVAEPVLPRAVPIGVVPPRSRFLVGPIPLGFRELMMQSAGAFVVAPLIAALCTAPWVLFGSAESWEVLGRVFILSTVLSWAVLISARSTNRESKNNWGRRFRLLIAGLCAGGLAFWLDGWAVPHAGSPADSSRDLVIANWGSVSPETFSIAMRYLFYFGLVVAAIPWWRMIDRNRRKQFRLFPIIGAAFWSGIMLFLWPWESAEAMLGVVPVVIAAIVVQFSSSWMPPPAAPPRKLLRAKLIRKGRVRQYA